MHYLLRIAWPILMLLLVLLLPFLAFQSQLESLGRRWIEAPPGRPAAFAIIVGLLSTDIFLPVPSSVVSTLAGGQLQWPLGTAASWIGLSLGAAVGFALARTWGPRFAARMSSEEDLQRMRAATARYGAAVIVLARGVPLLAEASVLLCGSHGMTWRRFLPPMLLSNLGIAFAYAFFGDLAEQHQWLPLALGISVGLPVLLAVAAKRWM